jgi:basic amino acid/polyamine antiporter, APA family
VSGSEPPAGAAPRLVRGLSTFDGVLLTVGSVIGTGIFFTSGDMARLLPDATSIVLAWLAAGLLTLTGALTYAELGAMLPRAGGLYGFLREAYGPLPAFLYGWTSFSVIMSGGIAAIAVGFGTYLGGFVPWCAAEHEVWRITVAGFTWSLHGAQVAGAGAIAFLTWCNVVGLREGAVLQNLLTLVKGGAILLFATMAFLVPAPHVEPAAAVAAAAPVRWLVAFGACMVAALWAYDGWYGLTFAASEMKDPARSLPRSLVLGTVVVVGLYVLVNFAYFRAMTPAQMAGTSRVGEVAARTLFGDTGASLFTAAIVVSSFGCLSATILYSSRIYVPMAREGLFFRSLGQVHPRWRTPRNSLVAQSAWAVVLAVSGSYGALTTYVVFAGILFHIAAGASLFVLRRKRPDLPRPYRVHGYPYVPLVFLGASALLVVNSVGEQPQESVAGLGCVAIGLPAYAFWRRRSNCA